MNYSNHPFTKDFRQFLRRNETPSERIMWKHLKGRQIEGYKFRQQHGFGPYIMDFYCPSLRLCIEIDGEVHDSADSVMKDADRTQFLNQHRITVLRFRNEEVQNSIDNVIKKIKECIQSIEKTAIQTPNPLT